MDKYQQFRVFSVVAEKLSFTKAAEALNIPRATVSVTIQDLESLIGAQLFNRTTRQVSLTPEGSHFLERCSHILNDVEEAENMFKDSPSLLKGKIRIDMSVNLAREIVIPRLPEFLKNYPHIEIELSSTDYYIDLMREGIDIVLRTGGSQNRGLVVQTLRDVNYINCVSPSYVELYGKPKNVLDLKDHYLISYTQTFGNKNAGFQYAEGVKEREVKMKSFISVNNTSSYMGACLAGLGIIQVPDIAARKLIKSGKLLEILPKHRPLNSKLELIYHERRIISKQVRVFIKWLEETFSKL